MVSLVAVIGDGDPDPARDVLAEAAGRAVARAGFGLVCGGLGGVMEAACRGAAAEGSVPVIAILPGADKRAANPHANIVIPSGLGYARNLLIVLAADAVVAVGGRSGTLSEVAHAWQLGKPICALASAAGWPGRLAGEALDDKRADHIVAADSVDDLEAWLRATLGGGADRPA